MRREIYAEEIERFLEDLEAVASARVVANEDGRIETIYLTTDRALDDVALRRAVGAGLMSRYGLHLEGWRIHLARLAPPEPVPFSFHLSRVEERLGEDGTRVLVELRHVRDGVRRTTTGTAELPQGAAFRLKAVGEAAVDALRAPLEAMGWQVGLDSVAVLPFAGLQVAVVALSLVQSQAGAAGKMTVGAAVVESGETEAVVHAAIRALADLSQAPPVPTPADRLGRLQESRARHHSVVQIPESRAEPGATHPTPGAERGAATEPAPGEEPEAAIHPADGAPGHVQGADHDAAPDVDPDVARIEEIRPEVPARRMPAMVPDGAPASFSEVPRGSTEVPAASEQPMGGAQMSTQEEGMRGEVSRGIPRGSLEDSFYRRLVQSGVRVHIRCRDGYEVAEALIKDFGTYSLLIEARGVEELIFKHGIISIRPTETLPRDMSVQA